MVEGLQLMSEVRGKMDKAGLGWQVGRRGAAGSLETGRIGDMTKHHRIAMRVLRAAAAA